MLPFECRSLRDTVYPKKYAHGFFVICFVVVMQSFIMNPHEVFIHIHQGCFAGTGAIVRLPQCQWSKPDGYGKISQCITTTKHSKAKTVCIFLGIYCRATEPRHQCGTSSYGIVYNIVHICSGFLSWSHITFRSPYGFIQNLAFHDILRHLKCYIYFPVSCLRSYVHGGVLCFRYFAILNSLRPRRTGRYNADIFKCIFLKESVWIPTIISLKFVPKGQINNIPALVQIMAWRRPGDKPLSEPMMVSLLTHICVTRPQWVNTYQYIVCTVKYAHGFIMIYVGLVLLLVWNGYIYNYFQGWLIGTADVAGSLPMK